MSKSSSVARSRGIPILSNFAFFSSSIWCLVRGAVSMDTGMPLIFFISLSNARESSKNPG